MSGDLYALEAAMRAEVARSQSAVEECQDAFTKMMLAAEFGALSKMLLCVRSAASAIKAQRATTVQQGVVHESAVAATGGETPEPGSRGPDNG